MADTPAPSEVVTMPSLGASASEVPLTPVTANALIVLPARPINEPCPACCHWSLPCHQPPREFTQDGRAGLRYVVPLTYQEWLVWHHHVVTHQALDRRMQVFVA